MNNIKRLFISDCFLVFLKSLFQGPFCLSYIGLRALLHGSILSPLVGNTEHHVCNSLEFAQFINKQTVEINEVLVFYDVVSLFTKIPTDLAIQVAHKRLLDDTTLDQRTSLTPDKITSLLKLCLNATYFAFHDSFYQQLGPWHSHGIPSLSSCI